MALCNSLMPWWLHSQAEVDGEIRTKLVIILYEELRLLMRMYVTDWLVASSDSHHQQEVGEGSTTWNTGGDRCGVLGSFAVYTTRKVELTGVRRCPTAWYCRRPSELPHRSGGYAGP